MAINAITLDQLNQHVKSRGNGKRGLPDTIRVEWHFEDVQSVRPQLTNNQARLVLQRAKYHHDAQIGINWDVLATVADDMFYYGEMEAE
jgi:hypothetical protein